MAPESPRPPVSRKVQSSGSTNPCADARHPSAKSVCCHACVAVTCSSLSQNSLHLQNLFISHHCEQQCMHKSMYCSMNSGAHGERIDAVHNIYMCDVTFDSPFKCYKEAEDDPVDQLRQHVIPAEITSYTRHDLRARLLLHLHAMQLGWIVECQGTPKSGSDACK